MELKEELVQKIKENNEYYWSGNPQISDYEYDELVEKLRDIDPENPILNEVYAQKVNSNGKIQHEKPMLSLDKVYTVEELLKWVEKYSRDKNEVFYIQPKYDGISGKVENYNGCLPLDMSKYILSTRGNGYVGENITDKLPIINFETKTIECPEMLGEIVIRKDDFENTFSKIISPSTKKPYKNPRNATAGIMGTDDIQYFIDNNAKLTFVDYELYSFSVTAEEFADKFDEIVKKIEKLPYPMDGIVIKIADSEYGESLGSTAHHPRNAIAFKFSNPQKETTIVGIEWSFGKNCLTPVAILKPVDINGITVERASLSNYENIKKLNLKIGDDVIIERAGDVIPHIVAVIFNNDEHNRKNPFIDKCPCCNSDLKVELPEIVCTNPNCFETNLRRLYFSIITLGIKRIGLANLKKIVTNLNIKNLYDFMNLNQIDFSRVGFGPKLSQVFSDEINKSKEIFDYQFLACLNINNVGIEVAKLILEKYSIEDLLKNNNIENLTNIKGIGIQIANNIFNYIKNNMEYIIALRSVFFIKHSKTDNILGTVCFTGAMEQPRKFYENIAMQNNLKPVNSVFKELNLLVVADMNSNSSKTQKAKKYGIDIITVEEFMNRYNNETLS